MSRTTNLNLTGRAASIDLAEFRNQLFEDSLRREQEQRTAALLKLETASILKCIELEGDAFWTWYNDDSNVPAHGSTRARIELVNAHLAAITPAFNTPEWFAAIPEVEF